MAVRLSARPGSTTWKACNSTTGNRKPIAAIIRSSPSATTADPGDGLAQFDRSIGVNIYGWTRAHDKPCKDLARRIQALLMDDAIASAENSPVIAVDHSQCNGPYVVPENEPTAHYYLIIAYSVIGEIQ